MQPPVLPVHTTDVCLWVCVSSQSPCVRVVFLAAVLLQASPSIAAALVASLLCVPPLSLPVGIELMGHGVYGVSEGAARGWVHPAGELQTLLVTHAFLQLAGAVRGTRVVCWHLSHTLAGCCFGRGAVRLMFCCSPAGLLSPQAPLMLVWACGGGVLCTSPAAQPQPLLVGLSLVSLQLPVAVGLPWIVPYSVDVCLSTLYVVACAMSPPTAHGTSVGVCGACTPHTSKRNMLMDPSPQAALWPDCQWLRGGCVLMTSRLPKCIQLWHLDVVGRQQHLAQFKYLRS